jgi:hypothetical protein
MCRGVSRLREACGCFLVSASLWAVVSAILLVWGIGPSRRYRAWNAIQGRYRHVVDSLRSKPAPSAVVWITMLSTAAGVAANFSSRPTAFQVSAAVVACVAAGLAAYMMGGKKKMSSGTGHLGALRSDGTFSAWTFSLLCGRRLSLRREWASDCRG